MNNISVMILTAVVIAMALTGLLIPQILNIAFRRKLFDAPDGRKIHRGIVPRLGGISFLPSVLCAVVVVLGWSLRFYDGASLLNITTAIGIPALFLICSEMLLYLVGIADDLVGLRYRSKFAVQIGCAVLTLLSGVWLADLYGLFGVDEIPVWIGAVITGFVVVYVVNALNLIDGIDGLASGLGVIALAFYGYLFYRIEGYLFAMVAWATAGVLAIYFCFNVFGKSSSRTKIFMGDTGSLTIGMVLAFLALEILCMPVRENYATENMTRYNPMVLALSPLLVPVLDVARVALHRIQNHRNPFLPDRSHIHHKMLAAGMSSGMALCTILLIAVVFMVCNVLLSPSVNINILFLIDLAAWILGNLWLTHIIRVRERKLGKSLYV